MSIPNLPINFKDDILADTNQKRKYNLIQNDDGTVSFEDATEYQQTGSDFGAGQINATNDAINKAYSERMLNLEEVELVTEPGYFVDALAVKEVFTELNGNLSFLKHKTVKNGPYEFDCYTYMLNGKKVATIHGSWTGKSSPSSIVGGFSVYAISNLQLSPDDAELDIQKHVSVDFNPGTGGGGMLFIGNYEGLSASMGANGHQSKISALYCIVTSPPRTVEITWTLKCELYS